MKTCTHCGRESYREESRFCLHCGGALPEQSDEGPRQNLCTNPDCREHAGGFIYPDDARFCDACGSPTVFGR